MDANKMKLIIIVLAVLTCIGFSVAAVSCRDSMQQKVSVNQEKSSRFDLEKKINDLTQENVKLGTQLRKAGEDSEAQNASVQAMKNTFEQEQLVNKSLKEELQKVNKLKEALEQNLKEALTAQPAPAVQVPVPGLAQKTKK